jgi:hypothetical protein
MDPMTASRIGLSAARIALASIVAGVALAAGQARGADEATTIGVLDLVYVDTSGEPGDQTEAHKKRAAEFVARLKQDLEASGRYRVVPLTCAAGACASDASPAEIQNSARQAGAKLVLIGAVHKQSTLIQWAKMDIVATDDNKVVFDKLLTFRGDSDDAWEKAESFGAREIIRAAPLLGKE